MKLKEFINNKNYEMHRVLFFTLFVTVSLGVYFVINSKNRENALKKTNYTYGVIQKINHMRSSISIDLYYYNQSKKIEVKRIEPKEHCYKYRKVGDTILIKYSLIDNQVVEIEECFWNSKTKEKIATPKQNL